MAIKGETNLNTERP